MPGQSFFSKLVTAVERNDSLLCVGLDPLPEQLPAVYRSDTGNIIASLLAWNKAVIVATSPYVCAYKPNIAFYEALGLPGMNLLAATLAAIPPHIPIILDAKRGDIDSTAAAYAHACFDVWGADAVTVSPYLGRDSIRPFLDYPDKGLFVLCHTSNPGAADFQELEINEWRSLDREPHQPLYIHVARTTTRWSANIGLVVGATFPDAIRATRDAAPDAWFLVPGIGAQGGDLEAVLDAGLRPDGQGLIINASRSVALAPDPGEAARYLRDAINVVRRGARPQTSSAPIFTPALTRLVDGLVNLEAIKFGEFTLASGRHSPIYIDLRLLVSAPDLLAQAADAYAAVVSDLPCDRVAGVPYAALPIGTALSLRTGIPMIYPRKEAKAYGLGKDIEGAWQPGYCIVLIEDLITSGGSIIKSAERLREAGLIVEHVVVLIDREQGGVDNLAAHGITAHSVFTMTQLLDDLVARDRLPAERAGQVRAFLNGSYA